jgi:hypothetical protein
MTVFLVVGIALALLVAAMAVIDQRAAPIRAAAAQLLSSELAAEGKAFCEKHGMQANTQAHTTCASELHAIRDRQTGRVLRDNHIGVF